MRIIKPNWTRCQRLRSFLTCARDRDLWIIEFQIQFLFTVKGTVPRYWACTAMIDSSSVLTNRNRQKRRRSHDPHPTVFFPYLSSFGYKPASRGKQLSSRAASYTPPHGPSRVDIQFLNEF